MARSRGSSFRRTGGFRRRAGWEQGPQTAGILALTSAGSSLWTVGQQSVLDGLTIVRVRGEFTIVQSLATAVLDGFEDYALGMCFVSENAFGIGATAIPQPLTDIAWDGWFWHHSGAQISSSETTEVGRGPMGAMRVPIDSKGMRKLRETDVCVGVIELGTEIGTATVRFAATTRILLKLP